MHDRRDELIEATPAPRVQRVFAWYATRLLRKRFAAVRCAPGTVDAIATLGAPGAGAEPAERAPRLLAMSHASWWDPIVVSFLWRAHFSAAPVFAPMDARELNRFRFMRKLGIFGIDPDEPRSLPTMLRYLGRVTETKPETVIAITPQGRFTDPREPLVIRPGAAAIAARLGVGTAVVLAVEYAFWNDAKPEVFLRAERVAMPTAPTTSRWQDALERAMASNGAALAELVRRRDPAAFEDALARRSSVHPVYDLWLSLTGRGRGIETTHRGEGAGQDGDRRANDRLQELRS